MKKLILITIFLLSINIHALTDCPSDITARWHNCFSALNFDNGDKYIGEWKDDKYHGQGAYTFANGDKYVGQYQNGIKHGQGTNTYANGDKYVGGFKDGEKHGQGTYTWADGETKKGYYMNGDFIPDICKDMGLAERTEAFGNCVVKLIDKL